jgi:hypothetical protein
VDVAVVGRQLLLRQGPDVDQGIFQAKVANLRKQLPGLRLKTMGTPGRCFAWSAPMMVTSGTSRTYLPMRTFGSVRAPGPLWVNAPATRSRLIRLVSQM